MMESAKSNMLIEAIRRANKLEDLRTLEEELSKNKDQITCNELYHAITSCNVNILNLVVKFCPLHSCLEDAYENVRLNNIPLPKEMHFSIQKILVERRFYTEILPSDISSHSIVQRIEILLENINKTYSEPLGDSFLHLAQFVAKDINLLKRQLKLTIGRIPWEEMEFCLVSFISSQCTRCDVNLYYLSILSQRKIIGFLQHFEICLEDLLRDIRRNGVGDFIYEREKSTKPSRNDAVAAIIKCYPSLHDFFTDFRMIRDVYALNKMKQSIDIALLVNSEERKGQLVIKRALQIIGEQMKYTLESPNLSEATMERLINPAHPETKRILTEVRDSMSHMNFLSDKNQLMYSNIQNDIKKIAQMISEILLYDKLSFIRSFLVKLNDKTHDTSELLDFFQHVSLHEVTPMRNMDLQTEEQDEIMEVLDVIKNNIKDKSEHQNNLIANITDMIKKSEKVLSNINEGLWMGCEMINTLFQLPKEEFLQIITKPKVISEAILNKLSPKLDPTEVNEIEKLVDLLNSLYKSVVPKITPEMNIEFLRNILKIKQMSHFDKTAIMWIDEFGDQLHGEMPKKQKKNKKPLVDERDTEKKILELRDVLKQPLSELIQCDKSRMQIEMLVLDIMTDMEESKCLAGNVLFMDDKIPLIVARNLRNYIAHGSPLVDLLLQDSFVCTLSNAMFIVENKVEKELNIHDTSEKAINKPNAGLHIIQAQKQLIEELKNENMEVLSILKTNFEYRSRANSMTLLHHAAQVNNVEVLIEVFKESLVPNERDANGQTALHVAALYGNTMHVKYLIERGLGIEDLDAFSRTPLHLAVLNNHTSTVKMLINLGANYNVQDNRGSTSLHYAVRNNSKSIIDILKRNINMDVTDIYGETPLHLAAKNGDSEHVESLLSRKAYVNAKNCLKQRPLHMAAQSGSEETVKVLLRYGARVNLKTASNSTALHIAAAHGHVGIVEILLQNGSSVRDTDIKGYTALHKAAAAGETNIVKNLIQNGADIMVTNENGATPLISAARNDHIEIVKLLTHEDIGLNCKDENNLTALHTSAMFGHNDVVKCLLSSKTVELESMDTLRRTPLHLAAIYSKESVIITLLAAGSDPNAKDTDFLTPLHLSAREGNMSICNILLSAKAKINSPSKNKLMPLHFASFFNHVETVKFLLEKGAFVDIYEDFNTNCGATTKNDHSSQGDIFRFLNQFKVIMKTLNAEALSDAPYTPLHLACENGKIEIVRALLDKGALIEKCDQLTNKPLTLAARNGHLEVVKELIERGAVIDSRGHTNYTPLQNAARKGHYDVVEYLIKCGADVDAQSLTGETCLHLASMENHIKTIYILLDNKADVNKVKTNGSSALLTAVRFNYKEIAMALIRKGADVNANNGEILRVSIFAGQKSCTKILLGNKNTDLLATDNEGNSYLHIAVVGGNWNAGKALIKKGVNIEAVNHQKMTPLHLASMRGNSDFVDLLITSGANINANIENDHGDVLQLAVSGSNCQVVKTLIDNGVKYVNYPDAKSPAEMAITLSKQKILEMLIEAFPEINKNNLLNLSVLVGNIEATKFLVESGAETNIPNEAGGIPIHVAALCGYSNIVDYFINKGIDKTITDAGSRTLLHYAVQRGNKIEYLLENGLNINCVDQNGQLPIHYAANGGFADIVRELLNSGSIYNPKDKLNRKPEECTSNADIINQLKLTEELFEAVKNSTEVFTIISLIEGGAAVNAIDDNQMSLLHYAGRNNNERVCNILLKHKVNHSPEDILKNSPLHLTSYFSHLNISKTLLMNGAIYNAENSELKTPLNLATNKEIIELLQLIDICFAKVQSRDSTVVEDIKNMPDKNTVKAIMNTHNKDGKSIVIVAMENNFSKTDALKQMLQENGLEKLLSLIENKDFEKATCELEKVFFERCNILGEDNPGSLDILMLNVKLKIAQSMHDVASKVLNWVLRVQNKSFGKHSKFTFETRTLIVKVMLMKNMNQEAIEILEKLYEDQNKSLDATDTDKIETEFLLVQAFIAAKQYKEALNVLEIMPNTNNEITQTKQLLKENVLLREGKTDNILQMYANTKDLKGILNPHILRTLTNLAKVLKSYNHLDLAMKLLQKVFAVQLYTQGTKHEETNTTRKHIKEIKAIEWNQVVLARFSVLDDIFEETVEQNHLYYAHLKSKRPKSEKDQNVFDKNSELIYSVRNGDLDKTVKMIENGFDVNATDENDKTILHIALEIRHTAMVKKLLSLGADIDAFSLDGCTILHICALKNLSEIANVILEYSKINHYTITKIINEKSVLWGKTALGIAEEKKHFDVVKVLQNLENKAL